MGTLKTYTAGMVTGSLVGMALGAAMIVGMEPRAATTLKRKGKHAVRMAQKTMDKMGLS